MLENTLPQLEQLIEQLIEKNTSLKAEVKELNAQKVILTEENEMLQLEVLEAEEKQKNANGSLENLLSKLQSAQEVS